MIQGNGEEFFLNIQQRTTGNEDAVVITGIGLVSPLGNTTEATWQAALAGTSGIKSLSSEFAESSRWARVAALVTDEQTQLDATIPAITQKKTDRFIHLALMAGSQAMQDAGFTTTFPQDREQFGVYVGVGIGGLGSIGQSMVQFAQQGEKTVSPFLIPKVISNEAAGWLSMEWNLQGSSLAFVNACSSSADSLGLAYRMIKDGYADYMLAGGAEASVTPLAMAAFGNMRALSAWKGDVTQASRPFDFYRTGFVMGEGAAMLVLERKSSALKRSAKIYAEFSGYAATADAYHVTAMHPEGRGAQRAIQQALKTSQLNLSDIGYINAHGTGTPMNDSIESHVIKTVFGEHVNPSVKNHILVNSTKSMTGHLLGAAGALEVAFTALALHHQQVPPTINLTTPDPACALDYIKDTARDLTFNHAISNSFGFGGGNSVVVLSKV